ADDPIVAQIPEQNIIAGIALQIVVSRTLADLIAVHNVIAITALDDVIAFVASQKVIAAGTEDLIIPDATKDGIGVGIAAESVRQIGQIDLLDRGQHIALRIAGPRRGGLGQIDADSCNSVLVGRDIISVASVQDIGAGAPDEIIIAVATKKRVVAVAAIQ